MKIKPIIVGGFAGGGFILIAYLIFISVGFQEFGGFDQYSLQGASSDLINFLQICFAPSFVAGAIGSVVLEKIVRGINSKRAKKVGEETESTGQPKEPGIRIAILGGVAGGFVAIVIFAIVLGLFIFLYAWNLSR